MRHFVRATSKILRLSPVVHQLRSVDWLQFSRRVNASTLTKKEIHMRNQYTNSLHKILVAGAAALLLFSGCIESAVPKGPVAGEDSIQME